LEGEVIAQLEQGNTEDRDWAKHSSELQSGNSTIIWSLKASSLLMHAEICKGLGVHQQQSNDFTNQGSVCKHYS